MKIKALNVDNDEIIPRYTNEEDYKKEANENISKETTSGNKILDIIETKESLEQYNKQNKRKTFSKWNIFKHKVNNKVRSITKSTPTIRVMLKADYTIYPLDLPIDGKTVLFKGRRYKLDGYEHRLYELQGLQCIFVDVNDSRPLDLTHKYTNPAYDAREFCSLFDGKAIQDLMSGIESEQHLDKIYQLTAVGVGATLLVIAILWGVVEPEWQKSLKDVIEMAKITAVNIQQSVSSGSSEIISGR